MDSEILVELALSILGCSQKELSVRLGISPTQISKWKKGDHMSNEMNDKLRVLTGIGDKYPSFVLRSGSVADADKWEKLIHFLAEFAQENAETGYDTAPLSDDSRLLCWETFNVLQNMGVVIPKKFPSILDVDFENSQTDALGNLMQKNLYIQIIYQMFLALNDVYGFYAAYISPLIDDDELNLMDTDACNIYPCLLQLAATKIEDKNDFTPNFGKFKRDITKEYANWVNIVKERAFRAGVPLRAELLDIVYGSNGDIGMEAESESFGFNASRIHPDIYMNELLVGMRVIHQVLPAILKKLGLDEEFEIDPSKLRIK